MSALPKPHYTLEEYFALERDSGERYEYFDGEVFCMSGAQPTHSRLGARLAYLLGGHTEMSGCHLFDSALRVRVPMLPPYRNPDLSALCGPPEFEEIGGLLCLTNPTLLIEILSPSTAFFDWDRKFRHYQSIPGFCEYLLIAQDQIAVTQFVKQGANAWLRSDYGPGDTIQPASLGCELNLDALYRDINFESESGF